jgi:hypothetical protein
MSYSDIIGAIGVSLLLLAFALNLMNIVKKENRIYILMNLLGAGIACYASVLIDFIPFIILEASWALVALVALLRPMVKRV